MGSLTKCAKLAGAAFQDIDRSFVFDRVTQLRKGGMKQSAAAVQAVRERLDEVRGMRVAMEASAEAAEKASTTPEGADAVVEPQVEDAEGLSLEAQDADGLRSKAAREVAATAEADSLGSADEAPTSEAADPAPPRPGQAERAELSTIEAFDGFVTRLEDGAVTLPDFKAAWEDLKANERELREEMDGKTKAALLQRLGPWGGARYKNDRKDAVVTAALDALGATFNVRDEMMMIQWQGDGSYAQARVQALEARVVATTAEDLQAFAAKVAATRQEGSARVEANAAAMVEPKTLQDFTVYAQTKMREGMTFGEARMTLNMEQRAVFDALLATKSRGERRAAKDERKAQVRVAGQTVDGNIVETKHTQKGHDLFVVQLAERVSREDYETLSASAKKLGGSYSSFRGRGAVPGFQFRDRTSAEAFVQLAGGDKKAAQEVAETRRDAFADDASQSAVERLTEMAAALEDRADEALNRDRKTNTQRRAGMAARAEASASAEKALARTMRNIATAIESSSAKFLDRVRQKAQVELLQTITASAKHDQLRAQYPAYIDFERHQGERPTAETADYVTWPQYTAYRSDLAGLARMLLEIDGTKLLGQRILKVADDVSDAYNDFAKANLLQVSRFGRADGSGFASFGSKGAAEASIRASGLTAQGMALQIKRGEYRIVLSPSEAIKRGVWSGDNDKRITLAPDLGAEIVEKVGRVVRRNARLRDAGRMPWQFETAHERRAKLARMGIETPAELRAAVREYIGLREAPAAADKVKTLERAMIGRKGDGLDFFPTPGTVADEMVEAAGLGEGMRVLEPSAGWGHIAERIRAAGVEPDVIELSNERRDLLEAKGFEVVGHDFMQLTEGGYDRIVMNPPFSDGRDIEHVRHAFSLLKAGGRLVAIMGESAFSNQNKRAAEFRHWLEAIGGTEEKLAEGSFNDASLPVNTGANARMVVVEKATNDDAPSAALSRGTGSGLDLDSARKLADQLAAEGLLQINVARSVEDMPAQPKLWVKAEAPDGRVRGAYLRGTDQVWLFTDHIRGSDEFVQVALHEAFHRGLANTMPEARRVLREMHRTNAALQAATREQMTLHKIGKDEAIEEALADMASAGTVRDLSGWQKLFDLVRGWLDKVAKAVGLQMTWTDDMVAVFVAGITREGLRGGVHVDAALLAQPGVALSRSLAGVMNDARDIRLPANYRLGDLLNSDGKISWWHKSVGTQHNLAEREPLFKRVYDAVQNFVGDVSYYGTKAGDLAPRILPKLESWKDVFKSPLKPEEAKAIAAPIFEGTLTWARDPNGKPVRVSELEAMAATMSVHEKAQELLRRDLIDAGVLRMWQGMPLDQYEAAIDGRYEREALKAGVVWKDSELKSMFGLTEGPQGTLGLYREFRLAIDKSLSNLAISDMLRFGGADVLALRERALALGDVDKVALLLRDHLFEAAAQQPDRAGVLNDTGNKMIDKADKAKGLMERGYAPLSRFGQYSLDVVDVDGERVYFGLFETVRERERMARQMRANFPDASMQTGTVSQEAYKLFAGVSPETLELFGDMLGLEATGDDAASKAFQTYIKATKSTRSAMKRLIERKGIAGFSEDAGRVLAGFVYSNARQTASNLHMGEITQAVSSIPKGQGELQDAAVRLADYVKNPQEEAQAIRGVLFAQYLGGSVASALVNMTQPATVTFPYLSQFGGVGKAAARMVAAARLVSRKTTGNARLDEALQRAEDEGVVSPQEVHQLQAQAAGRSTLRTGDGTQVGDAAAFAANKLSVLGFAWGKVFGMAEQVNRRITFIAAFNTAVGEGMADPEAFATKAVAETQFTYNKGNKPRWARGAVGSVLLTFKQYSISYVELLNRMWTAGEDGSPERAAGRKAVLLALAVLMLAGGADGLPFMQDLDDLIDGLMQRLGYNFSTKQARREFLIATLGEGGEQFARKGLSGLPGAPIDVSGRMGMGNLLPGTGFLVKKTDHTRDALDVVGPVGDLAKRGFQSAGQLVDGDPVKALQTMSPVAARNAMKAVDMASTGMYRDDRGRKVLDVDGYDVAAKFIGFQPSEVAKVQEATGAVQNMIAQTKLRETEIADQWAVGIFEKDADKQADARAAIKRWNENNPAAPIKIGMPQVLKRVRAMRESKADRMAKTAPKEIRGRVRAELAEIDP